ncbi:MAG: hypothetical protein QXH51_06110 [Candidatus Bathyarchaeia archaeon]
MARRKIVSAEERDAILQYVSEEIKRGRIVTIPEVAKRFNRDESTVYLILSRYQGSWKLFRWNIIPNELWNLETALSLMEGWGGWKITPDVEVLLWNHIKEKLKRNGVVTIEGWGKARIDGKVFPITVESMRSFVRKMMKNDPERSKMVYVSGKLFYGDFTERERRSLSSGRGKRYLEVWLREILPLLRERRRISVDEIAKMLKASHRYINLVIKHAFKYKSFTKEVFLNGDMLIYKGEKDDLPQR